jgi:hypothetical protein
MHYMLDKNHSSDRKIPELLWLNLPEVNEYIGLK